MKTGNPKKGKAFSHTTYPIGTWKMPGGHGAYSLAGKRGEVVLGLEKKKKGGKKG